MKKYIAFLGLLVLSLSGTGVYLYNNTTSNNIIYYQAKFVADFSDDRKVVGAADNVFVGEVLKGLISDNVGKNKLKITDFRVKVLYNIKGELVGNISVGQESGYDKKGNLLIHMGDKLLKPGEIYLFATRGEENLINLHENGKHLLTVTNTKKLDYIKKIIKESGKVIDFRKAYENENGYEGELKITSGKNTYKSLSKEKKEQIQNIDSGFVN